MTYKNISNLQVNTDFYTFIEKEVLPGLNIKMDSFFTSLSQMIQNFSAENMQLLQKRDELQKKIDDWHLSHPDFELQSYKNFLKNIGYLLEPCEDFKIDVQDVDDEITKIPGPQLVVPVSNARFALNAVNARWGSLYDALYGTDVIPNESETAKKNGYNPVRGQAVIAWGNDFLDRTVPLSMGSYRDVKLITAHPNSLTFTLNNGQTTNLKNPNAFLGVGDGSVLLKNNQLHIELVLENENASFSNPIKDILVEAAITIIMDFEDSVATVSGAEKINAYRNFLGLIKGDLKASFTKNGKIVNRTMNVDKHYQGKNGPFQLSSRSLMLVRNVGLHMFSDIIKQIDGKEILEGILDVMVTALISLHDLENLHKNSKTGSMYIVKPKLHGPEEVDFTVRLFAAVEKCLDLKENSLKIGIMDEERRTTLNLKHCIQAAAERVIFINTGFLDCTGDEIHTSMLAGAMVPKNLIKNTLWIDAYEKNNVKIGLDTGFYKQAQIGKGMWPQPDRMSAMLDNKSIHLKMGANCAWVPSPTAAVLHATHYHDIDVFHVQEQLRNASVETDNLLKPPFLVNKNSLSVKDIESEINNNIQSILGYVVRWIEQGIGCSKVPDINDIGLMEDRATLRISSQHIANWLHHGICSKEQVEQAFRRMSVMVDKQNSGDSLYRNMSPNFDSFAFRAGLDLVYEAKNQPNGYTEFILRKYRQKFLRNS